jgi:hypothetical protein
MPQAADFTINNGAGTPVAKTFTLLAPASGLNSLAQWELREGGNSTVFPRFNAVLRLDPSVKGYSSVVKHRYPSAFTDTTTGLVKPASVAEFVGTVKMPDDFPETDKAHFVAYVVNGMAHALWKQFLAGRTAMT